MKCKMIGEEHYEKEDKRKRRKGVKGYERS